MSLLIILAPAPLGRSPRRPTVCGGEVCLARLSHPSRALFPWEVTVAES
jgi:hypothetical protein